MPMHPRPSAETSRPRVPSVRFCMCSPLAGAAALILVFTDLFHPLHGLAVLLLVNRNVGHCRRGRRTVPVLFTRRDPDHVAGPDLFDRPTPALRAAHAGDDDECLTEWMRLPGGAGARLECDARARHAGGLRCLK